MAKENIELHIIHNPKLNIEDNGFVIAIFIDGVDKNVLELSKDQMLHIGAILLNASRKFINNADKTKDEKQGNNMGISEATKQELSDNLNKALEKETPESLNEFLDEQDEPKKHDVCDNCEQQGDCVSPCPMKLVEKQGEQKPKFRVGDTIKNKKTNKIFTISDYSLLYEYYHDINHYHEIKFSEQDDWELVEQKPTVEMITPEESLGIDSDTYNKIVDECVYGEQKPAWSEEDKLQLDAAINIVANSGHTCTSDWLKSIKERVLPQPKRKWKQENTGDLTDFENAMMCVGDSFFGQYAGLDPNDINAIKGQANLLLELVPNKEWSEEDENILEYALDMIEWYSGKNEDKSRLVSGWLKSLKNRVQH